MDVGSKFSVYTTFNTGKKAASVLPPAVGARIIAFLPLIISGKLNSCTGVRFLHPNFVIIPFLIGSHKRLKLLIFLPPKS